MAHELTQREDGSFEMAYVGERPWHGLGQELLPDATIEEWKIGSGMDWNVLFSDVLFQDSDGIQSFNNKKVLYRSDSRAPLSVVSSSYKIVEPGQIIEFFSDLINLNGMKMITAGTLFGGKKFWAMAELGKTDEVVPGDVINGNLLLMTSLDGSISTTAKFVSTRVVCNNTLSIATNEKNNRPLVKVPHSTEWDASKVHVELGLADKAWVKFITNMRTLSESKITDKKVEEFFDKKFENQSPLMVRRLMDLYKTGNGSDFSRGTRYGVLQAVTDLFTHGSGRETTPSRKFMRAYQWDDKIKMDVMKDLLEAA